jgi:hypothetical protein
VYSLNDDVDVNYMIAVQKQWTVWIME